MKCCPRPLLRIASGSLFLLLGSGHRISNPRSGADAFQGLPAQRKSPPTGGRLFAPSSVGRCGEDSLVLMVGSEQRAPAESSSKRRRRGGRRGGRRRRIREDAGRVRSKGDGAGGGVMQTWRVFGVEVHPDLLGAEAVVPAGRRRDGDAGGTLPPNRAYLAGPVVDALASRLKIERIDAGPVDAGAEAVAPIMIPIPKELVDIRVVRRSLDARKKRRFGDGSDEGPRYTYVLDVDVSAASARKLRLENHPGRMELLPPTGGVAERPHEGKDDDDDDASTRGQDEPKVIIVGAGPAGLFCALTLAQSGTCRPVILERGQPVESRGRDIGALIHRRTIDAESNFAFGEGGAGTWSDGKLTTRIGRNSEAVRFVLETLVEFGAPEKILVEGSPHLGTDNLVRLLRNMRSDLRKLGGEVRFGARVSKLHIEGGIVKGVDVEYRKATERRTGNPEEGTGGKEDETIFGDAVVLATGHSARDIYEELHSSGVKLEPKGFASGFRVEHPQRIINQIQYGNEWGPSVVTGRRPTDVANQEQFESSDRQQQSSKQHNGRLPVASYRLATDKAYDGTSLRGTYSFCMCPGGQIVPASTNPSEVCVNGMSFSKRDSLWANSALVVTISPNDPILDTYRKEHGVLAGLAFQRDMEKRASIMGGGNWTVPVQRLTDFMEGKSSISAPPSSYRLGVKPAPCHEIYPQPMVNAFRDAVANHFEKQMPGFLCDEALLHAVETRTSSPVRIIRDSESLQAVGCANLFPAGEGAGFAGGIVSAAVDGMMVAESVLDVFQKQSDADAVRRVARSKGKSVGFDY